MIHWFLHYSGSDNVSGPWYGFWSGFGSVVVQPSLLIGFLLFIRHHNCHVKGCWRLGHPDPDHGWPACKNHHSRFGGEG